RYMWRDVERLCEKYRIPFRRPDIFPQRSILAARLALAAANEPWLPNLVQSIFRANFAEAADISDAATLERILAGLGQDASRWLGLAAAQEVKDALRRQTDEAAKMGIFGAPAFASRGELFWGNDRLEDAIAWHKLHA
ncbi:MAG: hypothetical protein A3I00_01795, partial [Betaproteobacteria bacterium RIFCSPLOWO2_02_FULL_64_12]